jgi:hypothetical protein
MTRKTNTKPANLIEVFLNGKNIANVALSDGGHTEQETNYIFKGRKLHMFIEAVKA